MTENSAATMRSVALVLGPVAVLIVGLVLYGRIPQWDSYHRLADQREIAGIPHFGDVATNLPFLLVGFHGLWWLIRHGKSFESTRFTDRFEPILPATLYLGLILTGVGSAYYHWSPSASRLFWDRLPLTLVLIPLFTMILNDHLGVRIGKYLFVPLLVLGIGSVLYWRLSAKWGGDDLRLYAFVQFAPMVVTPVVLFRFRSRYTHAAYYWGSLGCYGLAKAFELLDRSIFELTAIVSGHNLKHCTAALAPWIVVHMLARRRPSVSESECPVP